MTPSNQCRVQLLFIPIRQPFYQLVHLLAQYTKSCRKFMWTNDNHTDGVFGIIGRETSNKRKFIRSSFIVITLPYVVHTCQFYTFWSKSMLYSIFF